MKDHFDEKSDVTRRHFVNLVAIAAAGTTVGGMMFMGCKPEGDGGGGTETTKKPATVDECRDISGLTDQEKKTRESLQYVEMSKDAGKNCGNCNLYTPDTYKSAACGGCKVMKGPVLLVGNCTAWVAKS